MRRVNDNNNEWRIDMARELSTYYSCEKQVQMIVLGGSPSRGLADEFSDLDIIVYWETINVDWLKNTPLEETKGIRKDFRKMGEEDIYLESYFFKELKADFGHISFGLWEKMVNDLLIELDTSPDLQKSIAGFNDAVPLYGKDLYKKWINRTKHYPEKMAEKMVIYALAITMESVNRESNIGLEPPSLDNVLTMDRIIAYKDINPEFVKVLTQACIIRNSEKSWFKNIKEKLLSTSSGS